MKKAIKLFFVLLVVAVVMVSCTQRYLFYPIPGWNDNDSDKNPVVEPEDPISERYPDSEYNSVQKVSDGNAISTALTTIADGTKMVLSGGTYNMPKDTTTNYQGQPNWLFYIQGDDVAVVAADGENVTIQSDAETPESNAQNLADQDLMMIAGDNVVLAGLNIGTRPNPNKSVEVIGDNAIIDGCTFLENAVLYFNSGEEDTPINNLTVKNCTFTNGSMLTLCNGVDGKITIIDNTFEDGSTLKITGYRNSGWNEMSVDLTDATFSGNTFESGSMVTIAFDESNTTLNGALAAFDVSAIADNLGTATESEGLYGETNFNYTAN